MDSVLLVCAPFLSIVRPALGVSLLKAALERSEIPATVEYLNLRFADAVGVDLHESVAHSLVNTLLVGEWIFSERVNDHPDPGLQASYLGALREVYPEAEIAKLRALREAATRFVDAEAERIAAAAPALLGFSTSFQQNCASLAIARRVRELNPGITICFGGANCEGPMGRALLEAFPQIDYVFSGEADVTFPEFARRFLSGTRPYAASTAILSRSGLDGGAGETGMVRDLDALPRPDFTDYFQILAATHFRDRVVPALPFESSRGCWWGAKKHCRFCGLNGSTMGYRSKSPGRVLSELDDLRAAWDVPRFLAVDNILSMQHIEPVFGALAERESGYSFFYEIKANLTRAQLARIAAGGVTWIQPGIESLDDDILRQMEKGVTALQNLCLLRNAAELGLRTLWSILYGFPGERPEHYAAMASLVPAIEHLDPPFGCIPIRLDRFSPYFERAAELGFERVRPSPAYAPVYGLPPEVLARLAYFFEGDVTQGAGHAYIEPLDERVREWRSHSARREGAPVLVASDFDSRVLIEDTRSCAQQRWRCLSDGEAALLAAFREPRPIAAGIDGAGPAAAEAFEGSVAAGYLTVDKQRALSLVVDPRTSGPPLPPSRFPGGWIRPPAMA